MWGLRVERLPLDVGLRQGQRAGEMRAELRVECRVRFLQVDVGSRERPEVVIDRQAAAAKQDVEPDRGRERPVAGGIVRGERDRLAQERDRLLVIEVVAGRKRLAAQLRALHLRGGAGGLCGQVGRSEKPERGDERACSRTADERPRVHVSMIREEKGFWFWGLGPESPAKPAQGKP